MFKNINAIIFDMDGTLIDSMGVWKDIDIEYLKSLNIPFPEDLQSCLEGKCMHDTAVYMKERFNIQDDLDTIQNIWNDMAYERYSKSVLLKPGVYELLSYAKEHGYKLGVATSNSRILTDVCLKANGIFDLFDYILTGCESMKSKPDPDIYLTAAHMLNVSPENCLVFEDIVPGILAGKNAGMTVCGVDDIYSDYSKEEKIKLSDYYIESYYDIELAE